MQLSRIERKMLWNQFEIIKALHPEQEKSCEARQAILENGFQSLYEEIFSNIDKDELSDDDASFVYDILSMYEAFKRFEMDTNVKISGRFAKFAGFDCNRDRECKLASFTRFLVEKQERWSYLNIANYNSHMPIATSYRRMVIEWQNIPLSDRFSLSAAQVEAIQSAALSQA